MLKHGADILRQLDALQPTNGRQKTAEERIEAAVAARRADAAGGRPVVAANLDEVELAILERKRQQQARPAGFLSEMRQSGDRTRPLLLAVRKSC
ncbi:MAG: hypothetical protein KatS3mg046_417 [Bellilinea sp.]|nr:MAG: hypothetical protein KatS3mg046_417 [Bellilinea sp.]